MLTDIWSDIMKTQQYNDNIKNLKGTFAIENMTINKSTMKNLKRVANGKATYQQVVDELVNKYKRV